MDKLNSISELVSGEIQEECDELLSEVRETFDNLQAENKSLRDKLRSIIDSLEAAVNDENREKQVDRVAEHQRVCDQYVYRDRLLVQEFYFGIVVIGLAGNVIRTDTFTAANLIISFVTAIILAALWIHSKHLRIDRNLMWTRARALEEGLQTSVMSEIWENSYGQKAKNKRKFSATWIMTHSLGILALAWVVIGAFVLVHVNNTACEFWNSSTTGVKIECVAELTKSPMRSRSSLFR